MGIGTLGFMKGASKTMLDSIDAREEAEREINKQKQLAKFRADLEQAEAMKVITSKRIDYDKGVEVGTNKYGDQVGEGRPLGQSEIDAHKRDVRVEELGITDKEVGIENTRHTMKHRDRTADREEQRLSLDRQQTAASIAASNRSGRGGSGASGTGVEGGGIGDDDFTIGEELLGMRVGMVASLKARDIDPALISEAAASAAREARNNPRNASKSQRVAEALNKLDKRLNQLRSGFADSLDSQYKLPAKPPKE